MIENVLLVLCVLVLVGALNWLLVAINKDYNLVHKLLGNEDGSASNSERGVYALVGLSALVIIALRLLGKYKCVYTA
jgi:uncharacterized membrane protein YuzA (DUF378 family)